MVSANLNQGGVGESIPDEAMKEEREVSIDLRNYSSSSAHLYRQSIEYINSSVSIPLTPERFRDETRRLLPVVIGL
jgi:hypothetical protein